MNFTASFRSRNLIIEAMPKAGDKGVASLDVEDGRPKVPYMERMSQDAKRTQHSFMQSACAYPGSNLRSDSLGAQKGK